MHRTLWTVAMCVCGLAFNAPAQDVKTVLANAAQAMGTARLDSITLTGSAASVNFGQAPSAQGPWQGNLITNYVRTITFDPLESRAIGTQLVPKITGGPPEAEALEQDIDSKAGWAQALENHLLPWAFLKTAPERQPKMTRADGAFLVTYAAVQKAPSGFAYTVTATINSQTWMIDRVATAVEHPLWGDLPVENTYGDYRVFGGVKVPMKLIQRRGGDVVFDANFVSAEPNPPDLKELMTALPVAPPRTTAAPGRLTSEKVAEGVYRITGGYISLVVEFKDFVLVLEGGQSDARAEAVIAETKRLIPNKAIRYVFNTHYHFDHAAGLAAYVAEGATIITQSNNVAYLSRALSGPRTLPGDTLAKIGRRSKLLPVDEKGTVTDGVRTVDFYHIINMNHTNGMLIAHLPGEKIIFEADFTLPPVGDQPNEFVVALGENLKRLHLDYDRVIPVHAPDPDVPWRKADLERALNQ